MKKRYDLRAVASAAFAAALLMAVPALNSCGKRHSCNGECKEQLGIKGKEKASERDARFRAENPETADRFKVYVECSYSMDAYVNGRTDFKTKLHTIISDVTANVLEDGKEVSYNYIVSDTIVRQQVKRLHGFTEKMSPASFTQTFPGDDTPRKHSDIIEIIRTVADSTSGNGISMFVSDCVYSPEGNDDIDKALEIQQTEMRNILKNKCKGDKSFGVLLYRLESDFRGEYYLKNDQSITINGKRPYFVWFFGKESILAKVQQSLKDRIGTDQSVAGLPGYKYVPYMTHGNDHEYHYLNKKAKKKIKDKDKKDKDNLYFSFDLYADLSRLPLTEKYITDTANYNCSGSQEVFIEKIVPCTKSKDSASAYNYKYTVCVRGNRNGVVSPCMVKISLKNMLSDSAKYEWITRYDDPKGDDLIGGYDKANNKLRTFGIKSLADGITDIYKEKDYATFKIKIN